MAINSPKEKERGLGLDSRTLRILVATLSLLGVSRESLAATITTGWDTQPVDDVLGTLTGVVDGEKVVSALDGSDYVGNFAFSALILDGNEPWEDYRSNAQWVYADNGEIAGESGFGPVYSTTDGNLFDITAMLADSSDPYDMADRADTVELVFGNSGNNPAASGINFEWQGLLSGNWYDIGTGHLDIDADSTSEVPEPGAMVLMGAGMAAGASVLIRKKKKEAETK